MCDQNKQAYSDYSAENLSGSNKGSPMGYRCPLLNGCGRPYKRSRPRESEGPPDHVPRRRKHLRYPFVKHGNNIVTWSNTGRWGAVQEAGYEDDGKIMLNCKVIIFRGPRDRVPNKNEQLFEIRHLQRTTTLSHVGGNQNTLTVDGNQKLIKHGGHFLSFQQIFGCQLSVHSIWLR